MGDRPDPTLDSIVVQQRALLEIARSEERDPEALIRRILEIDAVTLGVERVGFWEYTPDRQAIVCRILYRLSPREHSVGPILLARHYPRYFKALEEHLVVPADDARSDPRTSEYSDDYLTPNGIGAMMDVPIWMHGQVRGIVCHEHVGERRHWLFGEQLFAATVANFISVALEARAAELALANSARLKRSILSNLSHEVRTPLNLILGNAEMLRRTLEGAVLEGAEPMLGAIDRASHRLVQTMQSLLDLSSIQIGMLPFRPEVVHLSEFARHELSDLVADAASRGLDFVFERDPEVVVYFDRYALASLLRSLVDNAVKFTPSGGIELRVRREGKRAICEIQDTGIGIDDSFRARLFQAFEQFEDGPTRRYEGIGVGLALARALAAQGGAHITLESALGSGTTVRIDFPAAGG